MARIAVVLALLVVTLIPSAETVRAQDSDSSNVTNQLWLDYYAYWHVKPSVQFFGDAGYRYLLEDGSWWTFVVRPSIRFLQGNWLEPRGGLGFFYTYNEASSSQFEIRPWQGR